MKKGNLLYIIDRKAWHEWLAEHYEKEKEVWLLYPKKASDKPRMQYNDAVEEALCFGWIDSTVKRVDENSYAQRFSPRNPKSKFSQANEERLKELIRLGKVIPSVQATPRNIFDEEFVMSTDILKVIEENKIVRENFQKFSPEYKRIRIAFIEGARKRPQEFRKRLNYFIEMTEKNKQFGFCGINKY